MTHSAGRHIVGTRTYRTSENGGMRLTVELGGEYGNGRGTLLTESVFSVVEFLADAERLEVDTAAVIDIRPLNYDHPKLEAEAEAFIRAAKGLMQCWVLERGANSCPVNLLISAVGQEEARAVAVEYFTSELGAFSRGATLDVRKDER